MQQRLTISPPLLTLNQASPAWSHTSVYRALLSARCPFLYMFHHLAKICSYGTHFHCYPDDTWAISQHVPIKADDHSQTTPLEPCLSVVKKWMSDIFIFLHLNSDKPGMFSKFSCEESWCYIYSLPFLFNQHIQLITEIKCHHPCNIVKIRSF